MYGGSVINEEYHSVTHFVIVVLSYYLTGILNSNVAEH